MTFWKTVGASLTAYLIIAFGVTALGVSLGLLSLHHG